MTRPPVPPLDPPMVPYALAGTGLWAVGGLVLLATGAPTDWLWTCLAGVVVGAALSVAMVFRDRRRARRAGGVSRPPGRPDQRHHRS